MADVVAPLLQAYCVAEEEVSDTVVPMHKLVVTAGTDVTAGIAGSALTVIETGADAALQPLPSVTVTVKVAVTESIFLLVVSPLLHAYAA